MDAQNQRCSYGNGTTVLFLLSQACMQILPTYLKMMIQIHNFVLLFCNSETTDGLPVLTGIFSKEFIAQTIFGSTISKKHCAADPETSRS